MQDNHPPTRPHRLLPLLISHATSAMIIGLCAALPVTGATFLLALGASCLASRGCDTPTAIDALVPITAITAWAATTLAAGSRQIRTLRANQRHTEPTAHTPPHQAPRGL